MVSQRGSGHNLPLLGSAFPSAVKDAPDVPAHQRAPAQHARALHIGRPVDVLEVGGVGDGLDASLERDHLVVAGGDHDGAELEALREVHRTDGRATGLDFGAAVEFAGGEAGCLDCRTYAFQLWLRPHEDANLVRRHALPHPRLDPPGDGDRLVINRIEHCDRRLGAVVGGDCAAADIRVAVDVAHLGRQVQVGLAADLVRGAVVDTQGARSSAHVDAERQPREGRLEDALAEVAGEEQSLFRLTLECGEEA